MDSTIDLKAIEPKNGSGNLLSVGDPNASLDWTRSDSAINLTDHDASQQTLNADVAGYHGTGPAQQQGASTGGSASTDGTGASTGKTRGLFSIFTTAYTSKKGLFNTLSASKRGKTVATAFRDEGKAVSSPPEREKPEKVQSARARWIIIGATSFFMLCGIGLALGLGFGLSRQNHIDVFSPSSTTGSKQTGAKTDSSGNDPSQITPLPFWDWANPNKKALGVSLGNWLTLERWMDEDWFTQHAPNAYDEWHFVQAVGKNASGVLDEHFDTWVTEDEVETMYRHGVNNVRIPIGFWPFIANAHDEPYVNSTQLWHMTRMLGWLWKRGMYAAIDLHGMPGSQSGDQSTGLNTTSPSWWNQENQSRSDQLLTNLIKWLSHNPYKSVVSGICAVNEPNGVYYASQGNNMDVTAAFYERSYQTLQKAGYSMLFHTGFVNNPHRYWRPFAQGKNASMLVITDNPYPGWFPAVNNRTEIEQRVCSNVNSFDGFPVPMIKTEYSLASGITSLPWQRSFYSTQQNAYLGAGQGSFFWSFKMMNSSTPQLALENDHQMQYSFLQQIAIGAIPPTSSSNQSVSSYLGSLPSPACGNLQNTYSPQGHDRRRRMYVPRAL